MHALGSDWSRTDVERFFRHLVLRGVLTEDLHITQHEHTVCYARLGKKASDVSRGQLKVKLHSHSSLRFVDRRTELE